MAFAIMGMTLDMIGLSVVVTSACDLELTQAQQSIVMSMPFLGNYYVQIIFLIVNKINLYLNIGHWINDVDVV